MARTYGFDHFTTRPAVKPAPPIPRKKQSRSAQKKVASPRQQKKAPAEQAAPPPPRWRFDWPTERANAWMKTLMNFPVEAGRWVKRRLLPSRT